MEKGQSSSSRSAPKLERKFVEKNRRNHLKGLYNQLFSLLPSHASQEALPLPDQIDEAINYIETLKEKLEKMKHEREDLVKLMTRKRPNNSSSSCDHHMEAAEPPPATAVAPQIIIHEMGPSMAVVFITGLSNIATFHNIIRTVQEEGVEVANASFQLHGDSTLQIVGEPVEKWAKGSGAVGESSISKKLKEMISGSSSNEMESSKLHLWDYDIENEIWGFDIVGSLLS